MGKNRLRTPAVVITLFVVIRANQKNATATGFFTADRAFSGPQNGTALAGDYLSATHGAVNSR
jgi:cation/acetate symporter